MKIERTFTNEHLAFSTLKYGTVHDQFLLGFFFSFFFLFFFSQGQADEDESSLAQSIVRRKHTLCSTAKPSTALMAVNYYTKIKVKTFPGTLVCVQQSPTWVQLYVYSKVPLGHSCMCTAKSHLGTVVCVQQSPTWVQLYVYSKVPLGHSCMCTTKSHLGTVVCVQ